MSIIHDYIGTFDKTEDKCSKLIKKCAQIPEIQLYLDNLDAKARLEQTSSANLDHPACDMIDKQNGSLKQTIANKVMLAINNSNIKYDELFCYTTRVNLTLGNDIDINDMSPEKSNKAFKIYMATNVILECLNHTNQQALAK